MNRKFLRKTRRWNQDKANKVMESQKESERLVNLSIINFLRKEIARHIKFRALRTELQNDTLRSMRIAKGNKNFDLYRQHIKEYVLFSKCQNDRKRMISELNRRLSKLLNDQKTFQSWD